MNQFFENSTYLIDEKIRFVANTYHVYDGNGQRIGSITEEMPTSRFVLSLLVSKSHLPFTLYVKNENDMVVSTIRRGWTFWLSEATISDEDDNVVAIIKQRMSLLKPKFKICDPEGKEIARVKGNWMAWDFKITDKDGREVGVVNKKWNGLAKELFTTADKYVAKISEGVKDETMRTAIVATAAIMDIVLKESKD